MAGAPLTTVTYVVPALRADWVSFTWENDTPVVNTEVLGVLDERWAALGFTGGALVHPLDHVLSRRLRPAPCQDWMVTLNVLLRVRGRLLLGSMPAIDDGAAVMHPGVVTDDPRLVAIARGEQR